MISDQEDAAIHTPSLEDFSFHRGTSQDDALEGRWWWCLSLPGWMEVESSNSDFATEEEATADAERYLREEFSEVAG